LRRWVILATNLIGGSRNKTCPSRWAYQWWYQIELYLSNGESMVGTSTSMWYPIESVPIEWWKRWHLINVTFTLITQWRS
jgi:hypothetical protein